MSEDEVIEFLVEGNTTSDNHFMNVIDQLDNMICDNHLLSFIRRVFLPVISEGCRVRSGPFQIQLWG